jgi:hypothetical protein
MVVHVTVMPCNLSIVTRERESKMIEINNKQGKLFTLTTALTFTSLTLVTRTFTALTFVTRTFTALTLVTRTFTARTLVTRTF